MYQNTSVKSVKRREKVRKEWRAFSFMVCQAYYPLFSNRIKSFKKRVINWKCPENLPRISISFYICVSPLGLTGECVRMANAFVSLLMGYNRTSFGFFQPLLAYGADFFSSFINWMIFRAWFSSQFGVLFQFFFSCFAQNFNVPSMVHCLNHFVGCVCSNEIEPRST